MAEQPTDLSFRQQELADLCLKLVSTLSFSEVCRLVVQAGVDLVQADRARIFLLGAEGFLRGGASAASPSMPALRPDGGPKGLRLGEGLSGRVAQTGLPIRVDDVREDPRWIPCDWTDRVGLGSYVGVPMRWGREMVGVFNCARVGRRPFTDADESVLSILAGYAAAAVQNARLHGEAAQSRDFFRSVVDDNADPIIITDFGGRIIRWNPSAGRMYGYSEEEVLGRHIDLLSSDPRGTQRFRSEVIERGEPVLFETMRRHKDGTEVPVSLTLSPVRQAEGKIVALVGVHRDIGERRRIEWERADHIVQLRRLQGLSQKIGASLALDEVLKFVVESASEILKVPVVSLNLREGDHFERRAEVNPFGPRTYETRVAGQGVSGRVAETREPYYTENVQEDPLYVNKAWAKQAGVRSLLAVPILAGDEVIGVLNCVSKEVRKFTEDEAFLLTTLANSAAVAIQNAERHHRLEEALEQERRSERERAVHVVQLGRLQELSQKISASLDLDEVLQFVVESVSEILKVPAVSLNLREGGRFVRRAEVNPFGAREHETRAVGEGATGWIAERKEPLYIEDVQESPLFLNKRWAKRAGLGSYLGVPVMSAGEVSGVLVCNAKGHCKFSENEVFLLTTLANSASIAIQNAERHRRLEEGLEQERRSERERAAHIVQLGRLQALSQKISASLDLDEVLQFVVESAVEILQAPYSALNLREGGRFVVRAAVNPFPGPRGFETRTAGQGAAGWVAEKKQNLYIEDVRESSLYRNREWAKQAGLGSFLGVPLMVGGEVIGILNCLTQGVRKFSKNEVFLLTTLANSASIAIQNAERHRQLEEALEQVQRSQELTRRAERLSALAMLSEGAAHELLNPANIIGLYAQRMEWENEEGSPGRKTAEVILRNVKRITRICDALRQFSQDKPPGQELLDPNALVGEVVRPLEPELRLHSIDDEAALGKVSKRVLGDPAELRQALFHLVRNAMDAMPRGGKLKVATREVEEEGRLWWEARVSDTGEGILPENLSRIFDPFFTTKPPDKATGLGLSVTHGIVERHGGKLWAESAPGTGATFILRLPAVREG